MGDETEAAIRGEIANQEGFDQEGGTKLGGAGRRRRYSSIADV